MARDPAPLGLGVRAVSFHGFAGAFAFALKNVGIELSAVVEPGGFGIPFIERNRELLGFRGPIYTAAVPNDPRAWDAEILVGNPPCSGFSLLNTSRGTGSRGASARQNDCMWAFVRHATHMNDGRGPEVAVFESVQGAFKQGRDLMVLLCDSMRHETGQPYLLTHVLMSGASVGAAQVRKRYFWVCHRIPFGIESPRLHRVWTYEDSIGDLELQPLSTDPLPYEGEPRSEFAAMLTSRDGLVGDHVTGDAAQSALYQDLSETWREGETSVEALRRHVDERGGPPESWPEHKVRGHLRPGFFSYALRVARDKPGAVITGVGGLPFLHFSQSRILTVREVSRLMGFPDDARWDVGTIGQVSAMLGKQVPVQSWEWMLGWVRRAVEGRPGAWRGDELLPGERLIDVTHDYKAVYDERRRVHGVDARSPAVRRAMESRPA